MSTLPYPQRPSLTSVFNDLLGRVRRLEFVPPPDAVFCIKLFADAIWPDSVALVTVGDARFEFAIPLDIDQWYLWRVEIFITTAGSGDTAIQVRKVDGDIDLLSTPPVIAAGDFVSCDNGEVDLTLSQVTACELLALDVDAAGGGDAKGLGATLTFRQGPIFGGT